MTSTSTPEDYNNYEPEGGHRVPLNAYLYLAAALHTVILQSAINDLLQVPLETLTKVLEHGGSSRKDDILRTYQRTAFKF